MDFGPFQNGEFVESAVGVIPKGWEVKPLSSFIQLKCPHCGRSVAEARAFRVTMKSQLTAYRCLCQGFYTLYSGTVFEGKHFWPAQAILLLRGVCKGELTAAIAREIGVTRQTVHDMRKALQANAERLQPKEPWPDPQTETDELFQKAGEKR